MLVLGSSCKYRLLLAERFDCTGTIINQLLVDSYQNPISEWQVTIKLHLVAGSILASELMYFNCTSGCRFQVRVQHLFQPIHGPLIILIITSVPASFPHCSLVSVTVLVSSQAKPSQNKLKKKKRSLKSFLEKGERPNDETAEDSKTANKMKVAFKGKYQKSYLNYRSIAIGGSYSPTHFA